MTILAAGGAGRKDVASAPAGESDGCGVTLVLVTMSFSKGVLLDPH
jgi:hypothetical protein